MKSVILLLSVIGGVMNANISGLMAQDQKISQKNQAEVFHLGGYIYTQTDAADACHAAGGVLASKSQQLEAFHQGASWCSWGWLTDGNGYFPNSVDFVNGSDCGTPNNLEGPISSSELRSNNGRIGATCYGVKPAKDSIPNFVTVKPFNRFLWSVYDNTAN